MLQSVCICMCFVCILIYLYVYCVCNTLCILIYLYLCVLRALPAIGCLWMCVGCLINQAEFGVLGVTLCICIFICICICICMYLYLYTCVFVFVYVGCLIRQRIWCIRCDTLTERAVLLWQESL